LRKKKKGLAIFNKATICNQDKQKISERWIDVFRATKGEVYAANAASAQSAVVASTSAAGSFIDPLETLEPGAPPTSVLRVRGLPFSVVGLKLIYFS